MPINRNTIYGHHVFYDSTRKETMIDLDRIKQTVDLVELIRSRGVELTQNGKGYKGLCPFHADEAPSFSVNPDKNLWHCFGCDKGGDAIRFVELYDQVDFKAAVQQLETSLSGAAPLASHAKKAVKKETGQAKPLTVAHTKLLARVIDFYHTAFCEDPRAGEYLATRGITDKQLFSEHKVGFANGTLLNVLPAEGEIMA